jgi:hypothetical protein
LSSASGISVAYVFIHIFPELAEAQEHFSSQRGIIGFLDHHVYIIALLGLCGFYGLERLIKQNKEESKGNETLKSPFLFYLHVTAFALYNGLIGYLLVHEEHESQTELWMFAFAMSVHFLVNDFGLKQTHKHLYSNYVRWSLSIAVAIGFVLGQSFDYQQNIAFILYGFLAGGVILNVLKEELPDERKSKFWSFFAGATAYAIILMII